MQINTSFEVPVSRDQAWEVLLDVEGIAPCMPGATLDGRDGERYLGRVKLKIGPITAQYSGAVTITETDPEAGRLALAAKGKEQRGAGHAEATVLARLTETSPGTTQVDVETTLNITGRAAQFGRSVMQDVAKKLVRTFADNLATQLGAPAPANGRASGTGERASGVEEPAPEAGGRSPGAGDEAPAAAEQAPAAADQAPPEEDRPAPAAERQAVVPEQRTAAAAADDASPRPLPSAPPLPRPAVAADDINVLALLASSPRVRVAAGVLAALIVVAVILIVL